MLFPLLSNVSGGMVLLTGRSAYGISIKSLESGWTNAYTVENQKKRLGSPNPSLQPAFQRGVDMKHIYSFIGISLFTLVLIAFSAQAATQVYVSASGAKLQAEKSASSKTVETLSIGAALNLLSTQGSWYQVSAPSGNKGWIYRGKVSKTAPAADSGGQESGLGDLMSSLGGSGISAGSADTARSIRGLSPEAEEYAKQTGAPEAHRKALDETLSMSVTHADIERLLKEGGIGEYAETP